MKIHYSSDPTTNLVSMNFHELWNNQGDSFDIKEILFYRLENSEFDVGSGEHLKNILE